MLRNDADRTDVASVATAGDYVALLRGIREESGLTYREIERRSAAAGHWLPRSTLANSLGRATLPREDLVVALLTACGRKPGEVQCWLSVRERIAVGQVERATAASADPPSTGSPSAASTPPASTPPELGRRRWRLRGRRAAILMTCVLLTALAAVFVVAVGPSANARRTEVPLLLSGSCPAALEMGANSRCVQELQERLQAHGFGLPADGWFGPYTGTRVMAFQVMSGLPSTAIVDERVKRALYAEPINAPSWPRSEIKRTLREAFPEDPASAVQLATCLSQLDPYWIQGAPDGSRRWGLFQFSDRELIALGVEPRVALDLRWNVQAARTVWSRTGDFRHWKCAAPI
ncbi:peptidoglycan-binding domain-containing protein [Micromonospora sp. NBC_01796]|uniref:peptidoglycan-binding domain-containing protein n=1 Tax=Micromonospora sp. NBC_01796 TaxID=2975987 RepID=UPI002DD9F204|nr:peptidoglycan-binding protein [Micromonospora sp. NBC_01796]WSA89325.1 peptidoglycan-binding protein [Micromonospora sp. NBC_01796]